MTDMEKVINELRFQLDSKEVKEQHCSVQLSVSDAEKILAMLEEQEDMGKELTDAVELIHKRNSIIIKLRDLLKEKDERIKELELEKSWDESPDMMGKW